MPGKIQKLFYFLLQLGELLFGERVLLFKVGKLLLQLLRLLFELGLFLGKLGYLLLQILNLLFELGCIITPCSKKYTRD